MKELEFISARVSGNTTKRFVKIDDYQYPDFVSVSDIVSVSQKNGFSIIYLSDGNTVNTKMNAEDFLNSLYWLDWVHNKGATK